MDLACAKFSASVHTHYRPTNGRVAVFPALFVDELPTVQRIRNPDAGLKANITDFVFSDR
jgi:hypothetical protein